MLNHRYFTRLHWGILAGAIGMLGAVAGWAQSPPVTSTPTPAPGQAQIKLVTQYSAWAGSRENAQSLVQGLRSGTPVTLASPSGSASSGAQSATFTPSTGKLGVGEVNIALSLAKTSLAQLGITNPTPAQLSAALNGGTVTSATATTSLPGVLAQRQAGSGWGEIAKAMGVKLGAVMSASKTGKSHASKESHAKTDRMDAGDKLHAAQGGTSSGRGNGSHGGGNSGGGGGGGKGK